MAENLAIACLIVAAVYAIVGVLILIIGGFY